jgi:oxygen-independent coproporphyrinogen-3 oxidase
VIWNPTKVEHLYVHVPFCAKKCHYCAFYSAPGSKEQMQAYVRAVKRELSGVADDLEPHTIFWGGGTPSLLPTELALEFFEAIHSSVPMDKLQEWTIEMNPATVSAEKARVYREHGVNRISMGVQTLDATLLDAIGRIHSRESAVQSYENLRRAGFENINLDLMFGLPGQTMEIWERTLREVIALAPEHISTYCLILEEDTEFWQAFKRGLILPNEDVETEMFRRGIEILAEAGYRQYEISNFAPPGREAQHNIAYWRGRNYYGLGPSACSTVRGRRWMNVANTDRYIQGICHGESVREQMEELSPLGLAGERAAFGLRMMEGIDATEFKQETGFDLNDRWSVDITRLVGDGLLEWAGRRLRLTRRGILFADSVAAEFMVEHAASTT